MNPVHLHHTPAKSWFAALWLPRFQLQAALWQTSATDASEFNSVPDLVAVLDTDHAWQAGNDPLQQPPPQQVQQNKGQVLHASRAAEQAGILRGMTASQALARCASLVLLPRNPVAEEKSQQVLLECAGCWTPSYESTQPGLVMLDLTHTRKLKPSSAAHQMVQWLNDHHLQACVGMAGKADLAVLAARAASPSPVLILKDHSKHAELLKQLPVSVLNLMSDEARLLQLWGIRTLAQLIALPRAELVERLGREGAYLWDLAAGSQERLLKLVRPTVGFEASLELEHAVETLEPLLFILRRLLGELCQQLAEHWRVAASQHITLRFDDESTYTHTLRVAEPTRDADLLLRILHAHLESVSAAAPIKAVQLSLAPVRPAHQQTQLFERSLRDPNRLAETLAQLEAMLGAGKVGRVQLLPSRRVDAFTLVNYLEPPSHNDASSSFLHERPSHGLCLKRYRPLREVIVHVHAQDNSPRRIQTPQALLLVKAVSGPWLSSGDWWEASSHWERILWDVQTSDGALYQLAHEPHLKRWVLDGIFV